MWSQISWRALTFAEEYILRHAFRRSSIFAHEIYYRQGPGCLHSAIATVQRFFEPLEGHHQKFQRFAEVDTLIITTEKSLHFAPHPEAGGPRPIAEEITAWLGERSGLEEFIQHRGIFLELGDIDNPWLRDSDWYLRYGEQLNPYLQFHRGQTWIAGDYTHETLSFLRTFSEDYRGRLRAAYREWLTQNKGKRYQWWPGRNFVTSRVEGFAYDSD